MDEKQKLPAAFGAPCNTANPARANERFSQEHVIFTTYLDFSFMNLPTSSTGISVDHELFSSINNVIKHAAEVIYKFYLSQVYRSRRTYNNLLTDLDLNLLANHLIRLTTYFRAPLSTDNTTQLGDIFSEMLACAVEILLIERHLPTVRYIHHTSIEHAYIHAHDNQTPIIYYRHKSLIDLVNKIEDLLFELHAISPDITIEVVIANHSINLLPLSPTSNKQVFIRSNAPEIFEGIVFNGKQTEYHATFLVKLKGSNKETRLEGVLASQMPELLRRAKYRDRITFSAYPLFKSVRGNLIKTDKLQLDKILSDKDPGQTFIEF